MSEKMRIKPEKDRLPDYINRFERGELQVPLFQRDFVWTNDKKLELFDSIKKGYPIGSILLWQPQFDEDKDYDNFGSESLGAYTTPARTRNAFYIIDGFQRLSTLIGCLLHPEKAKEKGIHRNEESWLKEFNIVYNLESEDFEINRLKTFDKLPIHQVPIYRLIDGKEFFNFQRQLSFFENDDEIIKGYMQRYEEISYIFQNYDIPSINIHGGTISEAIDIFQRLNSTGAPITIDWVVSARGFSKDPSFRLGTEIDNLLKWNLSPYNFDGIKRSIVLQCIINSFEGVYFDQLSKSDFKRLEVLVDRTDFIPKARKAFNAIIKASAFMFSDLYILDGKFIPYNSQLIFISDFFNKVPHPSSEQLEKLKNWFWTTTYANYFTIYNLSKQRLAYQEFQKFITDPVQDPVYYDTSRGEFGFETMEFPHKIGMGSVRAKALGLFMLKYQARDTPLDVEQVDGYKTYRLFSDVQNPYILEESTNNANFSENTVLVIDKPNQKFQKLRTDLSDWMLSEDDHSAYFITSEMKAGYRSGMSASEVLKMRKSLIVAEEQAFVTSFNIGYRA